MKTDRQTMVDVLTGWIKAYRQLVERLEALGSPEAPAARQRYRAMIDRMKALDSKRSRR